MWRIFVVLAAVFACTLSGTVNIVWEDCMFHTRITTNVSDDVIDHYRIMHDGYSAYMMNIIQSRGNVYYTYAVFDLTQMSSKNYRGTLVTNRTGKCETKETSFGGIHSSSFEYTVGPETAVCPDRTRSCKKYCDDTLCILLDLKQRVVEEIYLKNKEEDYITYLEDVPSLDLFSVECNGNTYTPVDYCPLKTLNLAMDCMFHTRITTRSSSDVTDQYRIMHDGFTAYMMNIVQSRGIVYYSYAAFDLTQTSYKHYIATEVTNSTGKCETSQASYIGTHTSYFLYANEPKDYTCPTGSTGCKKYCDDITCIIVDSNQRLVEEIYLKSKEEYYITYFDDVPTLEQFYVECDGNTYTPTDYCPLKTVNLALDCMSHTRLTTTASSEVTDQYRMMYNGFTAYMMCFVQTKSKVYYTYAVFDPAQVSYKHYPATVVTNMSGTCTSRQGTFGGIHTSYFLCANDPRDYPCPDGSAGCKKYCDDTLCIIVDSNQRLVEEIYLKSNLIEFVTYPDDAPTLDTFTLECRGESYTPVDYCSEPPSSSATNPSTPGSSNSLASVGSSTPLSSPSSPKASSAPVSSPSSPTVSFSPLTSPSSLSFIVFLVICRYIMH